MNLWIRCPSILAVTMAACTVSVPLRVNAVPNAPSEAPDDQQVLAALRRGRELLAANAPQNEALIIRNVAIHVPSDVIQAHNAFSSLTLQGRDVYVALSLAYELSIAAEIQYVERAFGAKDLMGRYFRHFNDAYMFDGRTLLPIDEFAHLDEASRTKLRSQEVRMHLQGWVEHALLFALAHELGHHVRNAFYLAGDSEEAKRQKEVKADEWAAEAMLAAGYSPIHGIVLLTSLLDFQERAIPAEYEGSHPPTPDRALHLLNKYRAAEHRIYTTSRYSSVALESYVKMEKQWENELREMSGLRAARTIASMVEKSNEGDTDASSALAFDYANGIGVPMDMSKAKLFLERAAAGGDFLAQSTLGVLYSNGSFGAPDFARARLWMGLAARVGEKIARTNLDLLGRIAPPVELCKGQCAVDAVVLELTPCIARARTRCVESCVHHYGNPREECESRLCNELSDEQRYFDRCFEAPRAETWEACDASCDPSAIPRPASPGLPSGANGQAPADDFSRIFQQVTSAARHGFSKIMGTARGREPDAEFTDYEVRSSLPDATKCFVMIEDDRRIPPSYVCTMYYGQDGQKALGAYRAAVARVNAALASVGVKPCTEEVRRLAGRVSKEVTECQSELPGGIDVRVRQTDSTYGSSGRRESKTALWVDAPSR